MASYAIVNVAGGFARKQLFRSIASAAKWYVEHSKTLPGTCWNICKAYRNHNRLKPKTCWVRALPHEHETFWRIVEQLRDEQP